MELSGLRNWTYWFGAITEDGELFFSLFPECATVKNANTSFLFYVNTKYNFPIVIDDASDFRVSAVTARQVRDGLAFVWFPAC